MVGDGKGKTNEAVTVDVDNVLDELISTATVLTDAMCLTEELERFRTPVKEVFDMIPGNDKFKEAAMLAPARDENFTVSVTDKLTGAPETTGFSAEVEEKLAEATVCE